MTDDRSRLHDGAMTLSRTILLALAVLAAAGPASAAERMEGRAQVLDGDTLAIEGYGEHVRLYGIDAPEKKQTCDDASGRRYLCGSKAALHLADIVGRSGRVSCAVLDTDRYGRAVAECRTEGGVVLNAAMVEAGWAVEYRQYSDGRYGREETDAKAVGRGLWAGAFVEPSRWRKGERLADEGAPQTGGGTSGVPSMTTHAPGCDIKGNVSASGRVYHSPGQRDYERTRIDEASGERWFCSAREAESAGWRPAAR